MTKERRLAIEMWKGIRNILSACECFAGFDVQKYKREFCTEHDLEWEHGCWFCQYIPRCSKCPLGNCDSYSDYDDVVNDRLSKDTRVVACNNIIKALGGEA